MDISIPIAQLTESLATLQDCGFSKNEIHDEFQNALDQLEDILCEDDIN